MKFEVNIEERKPIWIAISDLYLDTELQEYDFKHIASVVKKSPYSFEEIKQINKTEVFPVLYTNLISVAGIWTGFQEEWLVDEISKNIQKRNFLKSIFNQIGYYFLKGIITPYWKKIEPLC